MSRIILSGFHREELTFAASTPRLLDGSLAGRKADGITGARLSLQITAGTADLYLGGPAVVVGTIPDVKAGTSISLDVTGGLYGVSGAVSTVVILEGF